MQQVEPTRSTISFLENCHYGNFAAVKKYIEEDRNNPYVLDKHERSGLFYAIWGKQPKIIQYLLQVAHGIENIPSGNYTYPKTVAVVGKNPEIMILFLEIMSPTDFKGKIKELESVPPQCMIYPPTLEPLYVQELEKLYETPESITRREQRRQLLESNALRDAVREECKQLLESIARSDKSGQLPVLVTHQAESKPSITDLSDLSSFTIRDGLRLREECKQLLELVTHQAESKPEPSITDLSDLSSFFSHCVISDKNEDCS